MFVLVSYDTQDAEGRSVRNIVRTGASGQYWSSSASWTRRSGRACAELSRGREKDSLRFHFLSASDAAWSTWAQSVARPGGSRCLLARTAS